MPRTRLTLMLSLLLVACGLLSHFARAQQASARPVVYIVPLTTALVHVSIIGAAVFFLNERISWLQLTGVVLVMASAALIATKGP